MIAGDASQLCALVPGTSQSMVLWCHAVVPKLAQSLLWGTVSGMAALPGAFIRAASAGRANEAPWIH